MAYDPNIIIVFIQLVSKNTRPTYYLLTVVYSTLAVVLVYKAALDLQSNILSYYLDHGKQHLFFKSRTNTILYGYQFSFRLR